MSKNAISAALLKAAKEELQITWNDENVRLKGILARGVSYLNDRAGEPLDYGAEDIPRQLLFEYARYARAEALHEFRANYQSELIGLRRRKQGERYGKENGTAVH